MASAPEGVGVALPPIAVGAVLRTAAPRLVRDAGGPLAMFLLGWKLVGLGAGIGAAALYGLGVILNERRLGRPAMVVRVTLVLVAARAIVGVTSGSADVYLAQEIGIDALLTIVVFASVLIGRPLAAGLAVEFFPFTPEMRASPTYAHVMRTITIVWGCYFLTRGLVRLASFLALSKDAYVIVVAVSEAPCLVLLLAWSVRHTINVFRRTEEWAPLIAA
ncbi:MAG TPA: hypothetical protein VFW29_07615 [Solirubrobacteraceae bacterium]|nr:hypothetical protein [Solirubrobacteraceae bacterium]